MPPPTQPRAASRLGFSATTVADACGAPGLGFGGAAVVGVPEPLAAG